MPLYVDNRESAATIEQTLSIIPDAEVVKLEVGDFMIIDHCGCPSHVLVIERKTVQDLLGSLVKNSQYPKGRLREQIQSMNENADRQLVLVEGTMWMNPGGKIRLEDTEHETKWRHAAAQAIMYDEQVYWKIPVIWTADRAGTIDVVRMLYNRAQKGQCILGHVRPDYKEGEDRQE